MSLDISLYNSADEEVASMNWQRSPFGLCQWAEDNVGDGQLSLYHVCNDWAYDKSADVDRAEFKRVVDLYWKAIKELKRGYFYFDLPAYIQFVEGNTKSFPRTQWGSIVNVQYVDERARIKIPMEYFSSMKYSDDPWFEMIGYNTLEYYKNRFAKLVEFAELLQDKSLRFECSN